MDQARLVKSQPKLQQVWKEEHCDVSVLGQSTCLMDTQLTACEVSVGFTTRQESLEKTVM